MPIAWRCPLWTRFGHRWWTAHGPAFVAGLIASTALPGLGWWPAILAVGWMYHRRTLPTPAFADGWWFGLGYFAASLPWIVYVVHVYGHLPRLLALVPWLLLAAYLALFPALAQWAAVRFAAPWWGWALAWAASDFLRGQLLTGFPWNGWSLPLTAVPPLLAPARALGADGLAWLVLAVAATVAELRPARWRRPLVRLTVLLAIGALLGYLARGASGRPVVVALIQGNVAQDVKWTPAMRQVTLHRYEDLTRRALYEEEAELVVWPETAVPFYFQLPGTHRRRILRLVDQLKTPLLFGAPAFLRTDPGQRPALLNRAYLVAPGRGVVGTYDKLHLVPFGEYVPLRPLLNFLDKLVYGIGDFVPGTGPTLLVSDGLRLGTAICYEAIFPYEIQRWARLGANLLVQITNDAWFGDTAAPWQHFAQAQLRAVETGLPVVRAANTGVTGWIDTDGTAHAPLPLFRQGWVHARTRLGRPTWFGRFGHLWYAWWWLVVAAAGVWLVRERLRSRRGPRANEKEGTR